MVPNQVQRSSPKESVGEETEGKRRRSEKLPEARQGRDQGIKRRVAGEQKRQKAQVGIKMQRRSRSARIFQNDLSCGLLS